MGARHDHWCRCIRTLTAEGGLEVDSVILPDGEQHKSVEVLMQVCAASPACMHVLHYLPSYVRQAACQALCIKHELLLQKP